MLAVVQNDKSKWYKFMSQCPEKVVRGYGVEIYDHQEAVEFIIDGKGENKRVIGLVAGTLPFHLNPVRLQSCCHVFYFAQRATKKPAMARQEF